MRLFKRHMPLLLALLATTGHSSADKEQAKKAARQNMKWHEQLISHFAEIFFPLLPALISGGLISFLQFRRYRQKVAQAKEAC